MVVAGYVAVDQTGAPAFTDCKTCLSATPAGIEPVLDMVRVSPTTLVEIDPEPSMLKLLATAAPTPELPVIVKGTSGGSMEL